MNERLILMIKQPSEPLRNSATSAVQPAGTTAENAEVRRGWFLRLCAALCTLWSIPAFAQPAWEPLPPLPEPNGGFVCGHAKGRIVVKGGTNWEGGKKNWLSRLHRFDPVRREWENSFFDGPLAYAVSIQNGNDALLEMGGTNGKEPQSIHKGRKQVVLSVGAAMPGPQGDGLVPYLLICGGTDDPANLAGVTAETHAATAGGTIKLADYPGKPFATAASAVVGEELFVFGGMNYDAEAKLPANTAEAYAFSPEKNVWRKLTPLAVPTRGLTAVTLDESHIYIAGGYREDFTAEAVIYDVKADSYRKAIALPYAAMVGLVRMGDHVYCLGGEDKKQSRTDKFFRISVAELLK